MPKSSRIWLHRILASVNVTLVTSLSTFIRFAQIQTNFEHKIIGEYI
ncbi:hypothetical protein HYW32_01570 [Candidatus Berkelbacteria bacterium]|nr:hypothetical protein [Candidatus Berkelbacteria bacterium]